MYIEELARRSLLLYLRARPTPRSLRESLGIHTLLSEYIGNGGALIQYRQAICPVTKVRLPKIRALIEDYGRGDLPQEHVLWPGATMPEQLTPLEKKLLELGDVYEQVSVTAVTRDATQINRVRKYDTEDIEDDGDQVE